jgi:hypothetical protein
MCRNSAGGSSGTWTSAYTATLANDSGAWNGFNLRVRFDAAALSDISGRQVRLTIGSSSTEGVTISEAWVGIESGGSFQFASAAQVKWSGSGSTTIALNSTKVSDAALLSVNGASDSLVLAMWVNGGAASDSFKCSNAGGNVTGEYKSGTNESSTTGALTGYTGTTSSPVSLIELLV